MQTVSVTSPLQPVSPQALTEAADVLRAGGLVAFPTETVYGLGADARNDDALARLFAAKGRPENHPVIVHLGDMGQVGEWADDFPEPARILAEAFWPGPMTLLLPRKAGVSSRVTGGLATVGLRVPDHPAARALLQAFGGGIAAPSANRFGRLSPTTAGAVLAELGNAVDLVLDAGPCAVGVESTIIDCTGSEPRILRPGMVTAEAVAEVLGRPVTLAGREARGRAPGTLASHYAPGRPLVLVPPETLAASCQAWQAMGKRLAVLVRTLSCGEVAAAICRQAPADAEAYARALYATLRELDTLDCDMIAVEAPPPGGAWQAVSDRLHRAATCEEKRGKCPELDLP